MKKNKKILAGALLLCATAAIAGVIWKKMTSEEKEKKTEELPRTEVSTVQTETVSDASAEVSQAAAVTGSAQDIEEVPENAMTQDAEQAEAEPSPEVSVRESEAAQLSQETAPVQEVEEIPDTGAVQAVGEVPEESVAQDFYISEIPDDIFAQMQGKSYKADCTVPREQLRYVHVLHRGFDGSTKEGELVVNVSIAQDVLEIFEKLYRADYPIEKVRLVDAYNADDEASMSDNNSSAFNFRFISHTTKISKHGLGMAVDINTLYNPYIKQVNGQTVIEPANAGAYVDRTQDFPYKIDHQDLCYKLFTEHGFTWGGDWTHSKDYQHFEK